MTITKWKVSFSPDARKEYKKLDFSIQKLIITFLERRIETQEDPRRFGKPLSHQFKEYWRYRVDDYRLICRIENQELIVYVVHVSDCKDVYE